MFVNIYDKNRTLVLAAPLQGLGGLGYIVAEVATDKLPRPDYDVCQTREAAVSASNARKKGTNANS